MTAKGIRRTLPSMEVPFLLLMEIPAPQEDATVGSPLICRVLCFAVAHTDLHDSLLLQGSVEPVLDMPRALSEWVMSTIQEHRGPRTSSLGC